MKLVRIVRNVEFGKLFDSFFISAVSTILIVRFYLQVAGYPQLGNSTLHISHLLPGTLLMLAAIIIMLAAINRAVRESAAVMAGIGFGLAWDELGKFITRNNNYFFKPTLGLIYLTFVLLYLLAKYAASRRLTQEDYLANVIDLLKEAAIKDLDIREYDYAKELMLHVSPRHELYKPTLELLEKAKPTVQRQPLLVDKVINAVMAPVRFLARQKYFTSLVVGVAVAYGLLSVFVTAIYFYGALSSQIHTGILNGDESDLVGASSAFVTVVCSVFGSYEYWRGRHKAAFKLFESGLLVQIFVGQIVLFFKSSGVAIAGLFLTLILLGNLKLLGAEETHQKLQSKNLNL